MRALFVAVAVVVDVNPVDKIMGNLKSLEAKLQTESTQLHREADTMKRQVASDRADPTSFAQTAGLSGVQVTAEQAKLRKLDAKIQADALKFHADAAKKEGTFVTAADKAAAKAKFDKILHLEKATAQKKVPSSLLETSSQQAATEDAEQATADKRAASFEQRRAERKKQFAAAEKAALAKLSEGKVPSDPSASLKSAVSEDFDSDADDAAASSFAQTQNRVKRTSEQHQQRFDDMQEALAAHANDKFGAMPSSFLEGPNYAERDAEEKRNFDRIHDQFEKNLARDKKAFDKRFATADTTSLLQAAQKQIQFAAASRDTGMNPERVKELAKRLDALKQKMVQDARSEEADDSSLLETESDPDIEALVKQFAAKMAFDEHKLKRMAASSFAQTDPDDDADDEVQQPISPEDAEENADEDKMLAKEEAKMKDIDAEETKLHNEYVQEKTEFESEDETSAHAAEVLDPSSLLQAPNYAERDAEEKRNFDRIHDQFEKNLARDKKAFDKRFATADTTSLLQTAQKQRYAFDTMAGEPFAAYRKAQAEASDADAQFVEAIKKFNVMTGQPGATITAGEMTAENIASSFAETGDPVVAVGDHGPCTQHPCTYPSGAAGAAATAATATALDAITAQTTQFTAQCNIDHQTACNLLLQQNLPKPEWCDSSCVCSCPDTGSEDVDDTPVVVDATLATLGNMGGSLAQKADRSKADDDDDDEKLWAPQASLLQTADRSKASLLASMAQFGRETSLLQASESASATTAQALSAKAHARGKAAAHAKAPKLPYKSEAEAEAENARGWKTVQAEIDGLKTASGDYAAEMSSLPPIHLRILPESFAETSSKTAHRRAAELPVLDSSSPELDAVFAQEAEKLAEIKREDNQDSEQAQAKLRATFEHEALKTQNYQALSSDPSERSFAGSDLGASSYLEEGQFRR